MSKITARIAKVEKARKPAASTCPLILMPGQEAPEGYDGPILRVCFVGPDGSRVDGDAA